MDYSPTSAAGGCKDKGRDINEQTPEYQGLFTIIIQIAENYK